ncbi:MAG TPA: prepilin-type N-terminal cleavage/methylation domain-containing protein [Methylocystis sp.]|nr:prepilin-type N-terminal cleavage/methylation domain-containing protein [Methylocystis sp.]
MRNRLKERAGFTLIEALVAFSILALAMAQLLAAASGAAQNQSRADFLLRATRLGQTQLDSLGVDSPLAPGVSSGQYADGLLWTLVVVPHRQATSPVGSAVTSSYWAKLTIRRPTPQIASAESLTLSTLKLVTVRGGTEAPI